MNTPLAPSRARANRTDLSWIPLLAVILGLAAAFVLAQLFVPRFNPFTNTPHVSVVPSPISRPLDWNTIAVLPSH